MILIFFSLTWALIKKKRKNVHGENYIKPQTIM